MTEKVTSPTKAILRFFNTPGYEPLGAREILEFKKADPKGYDELGKLALQEVNVKE